MALVVSNNRAINTPIYMNASKVTMMSQSRMHVHFNRSHAFLNETLNKSLYLHAGHAKFRKVASVQSMLSKLFSKLLTRNNPLTGRT